MEEKQALEYLVGLGETKILEVDGKKFSTNSMYRVVDPKPAQIEVTTLTSLIDYLTSGLDKKASPKLLVHVISPTKVALYSELREDRDRETYMLCSASIPRIFYEKFLDMESFNIMLQSGFVDNEGKDLLLKVVGNIKEEGVQTIGDDGVTQAVTIKTGIATVGNVKVPNPVILAPYRTFPEIDQPESKFIFRMQSGPSAAIFEADGGSWKNNAMERIKDYLAEHLKDYPEISIIS